MPPPKVTENRDHVIMNPLNSVNGYYYLYTIGTLRATHRMDSDSSSQDATSTVRDDDDDDCDQNHVKTWKLPINHTTVTKTSKGSKRQGNNGATSRQSHTFCIIA